MRSLSDISVAAALIVLLGIELAHGAIAGLQIVGANGTLSLPVFVTNPPGDRNRVFVAQLDGTIKVIDLNTNLVSLTPFLTIPAADIDVAGEGGLLGLAFHPDYLSTDINNPGRGKFYVYVTVDNSLPEETSPFSSHIREYSVIGDPATSNIADATFTREILSFVQPQANHNGGWIGFNPKLTANQPQYLYIASGDGGAGYDFGPGHTEEPDVKGNAQDVTDNLLGKMLRIDISSDAFPEDPDRNYAIPPSNPFVGVAGDDEIFAYGLRNPFRAASIAKQAIFGSATLARTTVRKLIFFQPRAPRLLISAGVFGRETSARPASAGPCRSITWRRHIPTPTPTLPSLLLRRLITTAFSSPAATFIAALILRSKASTTFSIRGAAIQRLTTTTGRSMLILLEP